jgi:membrane-bound ClpP family serine protease
MIGQTGRCVSPLRPVGVCDFGGRRVSCLAEYGLIESGATVVGTRITGGNLAVVEKKA